jgi:hypothetical protein
MSEGPELNALADALRRLAPSSGQLDRDELMFRAGQASARRSWRWPLATALSTAVALGLGAVLLFRPPTTHVVERIVQVPVEKAPLAPVAPPDVPAPAPVEAPAPSSPGAAPFVALERYRQIEERLLLRGLEGLGTPPPAPPPPRRSDLELLSQPF